MSNPSEFRFRRVARDILDLGELQLQLLSIDSQEARQQAGRAVAWLTVALALGGSALTVVMVGAGFALADWAEWPVGLSLLAVAAIVFVFVLLLGYFAYRALRSATSSMQECKSEFVENVKWLKATLIAPGSSPRHQMRAEDFPPTDRYPEQAGVSQNGHHRTPR